MTKTATAAFTAVTLIWAAAAQSLLSSGNWFGWTFVFLAILAVGVWIALMRQVNETFDRTLSVVLRDYYFSLQPLWLGPLLILANILLAFGVAKTGNWWYVGGLLLINGLIWLLAYGDVRQLDATPDQNQTGVNMAMAKGRAS